MNPLEDGYFSVAETSANKKGKHESGIYINTVLKPSRSDFFMMLIHELNHAKQYQISYMTNAEEAVDGICKNDMYHYILKMLKITNEKIFRKRCMQEGLTDEQMFSIILEKIGINVPEELQNMKEGIINGLGTTRPNSLPKDSKEYDLGLKYIENFKNYTANIFKGYFKQPIEKESFKVSKLMDKSCNYFLKPSQRGRISILNVFQK